jgi:hypothetical protein
MFRCPCTGTVLIDADCAASRPETLSSSGLALRSFLFFLPKLRSIPRYELLLRELRRYTTEEHPEYAKLNEVIDASDELEAS